MRIGLQKNAYMDVWVIVWPFRTFREQTYFEQKNACRTSKSKHDARHFQEMPLARVVPAGTITEKHLSEKFHGKIHH
jgi:hypothetical protein